MNSRRQFLKDLSKTIAAGSAMVAFGIPDLVNPIQVIPEAEYLAWDGLAEAFRLEMEFNMKMFFRNHSLMTDQIFHKLGTKVGSEIGEEISKQNLPQTKLLFIDEKTGSI